MNCNNCTLSFEVTDEDRAFYKKIDVPKPTHCSTCRMQRRFAVRNERFLYPDECDLCHKKMISAYSPDKPFKVYCTDCWHSDKWNAEDYSQDFDFSRPFFEQFAELQLAVPRINLAVMNADNCEYSNYVADTKNCYLCFGSIHCEDCLYGSPYESKDCVDTFLARECEMCYECVDTEKSYSCSYCQDCSNCSNCLFCYDCRGCKDCIGSALLRNKQYYIFNEPHTKEEYEAKKASLNTGSYSIMQTLHQRYTDNLSKYPRKYAQNLQCENSTGNYIIKCKNTHQCFDVKHLEDCSYCAQVIDGKDSHDINYCEHFELAYDYIGFDDNYDIKFSNTCGHVKFTTYSAFCHTSENLFGSIALHHKKNCILNKQYTPEEYSKLKLQIINYMKKTGEYGEFFPVSISPFAYNETVAHQYLPEVKEAIMAKGWKWKEKDKKEYKPQSFAIPDDINDVGDDVLKQALACNSCGKNYRIIPQELKFYKKQHLPLPRACPDCRYDARLSIRPPRKLWERSCNSCDLLVQSTYPPEDKSMVLCDDCYLKEIN